MQPAFVCISVLLAALTLVELHAVRGMYRRAAFGYGMLLRTGVALLSAVLTGLFACAACSGTQTSAAELAPLCLGLPWHVFLVLSVPMLTLSIMGLLSGVWLLRENGLYPANTLSIGASVAWLVMWGGCLHAGRGSGSSSLAVATCAVAVSLVAIAILSAFICNWLAALRLPRHDVDYLIVLGCGMWADGTPAPILRKRIDRALRYDAALRADGRSRPIWVASGGQGADEPISEAACIRRYLVAKGIDERRIVMEDRSTNTTENLILSCAAIAQYAGADADQPHIAFVTTNYHVFRTYVLARREGLRLEGLASPTTWRFWPNAFIRELIGLAALTRH